MPSDTIDRTHLTDDERRWLREARAPRRRRRRAVALAVAVAVALVAAAYLQGRR